MASFQEEKIQSSTVLEMLNSKSLPLAKKLSLVQLLCTVEQYSKLCNYDVVMKWFADTLQTLPSQEVLSVYKCLAMCLKSDMISTDNRKLFFKTLLPCFMLPDIPEDLQLSSAVRDCLISIFNNAYLLEILKYEIGDLSTCVEIFLVTYSFSGVIATDVAELFEVIKSMYKGTLLRSDFVEEFVENMLPNIFTFVGTNDTYIKDIDSCFSEVLFPESESASKYLQAFKNYKTDWTPNNQYEFLVKVIVSTPFICGSPMLSGKFYELFCRHFIASCANSITITFELFKFICLVIGCKPNFNIELSLKANAYDKGFSLQCLNSVLVSIKGSPQITQVVAMENTVFSDYINSLTDFIVSQSSSETSPEFYKFVCNVINLIPSRCETVFRNALSVVILKHKDYDESVTYAEMLGEVLKVYSKFYNISKFVSHLFEEAVKAMTIAKDVSRLKWQYLLPWTFLSNHLENTAIIVLGMASLYQILDVVNNLLMDCVSQIQNQEPRSEMETGILVLQFEILGKIWCVLFANCEVGSLFRQTRYAELFEKIFANVKNFLALTGKLLLSVDFNTKLINVFLEMTKLWGHVNYILEGVPTVCPDDTDLRDLSLLYDFLDAQQWATMGKIISTTENEICQTKFSDLLLTNLQCSGVTSYRAKKHFIGHIVNTVSVEWLWDNNRCLLPHIRGKHLAKLCERLASEESAHIPIQIKLQSLEYLCELRFANFFLPVYIIKTAGKLLSADGRNLTASVSGCLTTEFLVAEVKETLYTGNSVSSLEIAEAMNSMIVDRICESTYHKYDERTVTYIQDAFQILQRMCAHNIEKHLRLLLFLMFVALCKDLTEDKSLQKQTFSFILDVLVGSCTCSRNILGLCEECGTHLKLPVGSDYSKLLEWLYSKSKEYSHHTYLMYYLCATIGRDPDLVERTIKSLASHLELISSFYQVLSKNPLLTPDGTINKRKRRKFTRVTKLDAIAAKCLEYLTDGVVKVVSDRLTALKRSTMSPYAFALQCAIHNDEGKLKILLQHFGSYWKMLKICSKESPSFIVNDEFNLIHTLLKDRKTLSSSLPEKFIQVVWERLQSSKTSPLRTSLVMSCLEEAEVSEYNWIIKTLCDEIKMCKLNEVADMTKLWSLAVETHVDSKKMVILCKGIESTCHECTRLIKLMTDANKPEIAQDKSTIILFMVTAAQTKQVRVTTIMLDGMFEALNYIRPEEPDGIETGLRLLSVLLIYRDALVHDRIPSFLQRFRFLLSTVAAVCHINEQSDPNDWAPYTKSAYYIERLSQLIVKHDVHFARVSPNIICHLISCFEMYTLPSVIKMHYINSVYLLLSICDKHGREYVQRLMPEPSAEMFKTLYNTYQKYYKYAGKV